jgi:hypothetical protein
MLEMRSGKRVAVDKSVRHFHGHVDGNEASRRIMKRLNPGTDSSSWAQNDNLARASRVRLRAEILTLQFYQ